MKTSKEMQLEIIDKMRENVESDKHVYTNIQVKGKGVLSGWLDKGDHYLDFWNCEHRVKHETITINGVDITKPLEGDDIKSGLIYYYVDNNKALYEQGYGEFIRAHGIRFAYSTKEQAIEASKALFGIKE